MPTLYTTIGPWTFPTFNLVLTLAILVSAGLGLRRLTRPGAVADVYLAALVGGVVGARLFHVLLDWDYFAANLSEAFVLSLGGLDWHGAVLGGLAGLYSGGWVHMQFAARRGLSPTRAYRFADLLDTLTPALPLISLAAWWGCLAASCSYGAQVDNLSSYPALAVSETADVYGIAAPRYNTQLFGMLLSLAVLLWVGLLFWRGWLRQRRFWLTLALLSAGLFVIGFFRGDYATTIVTLRSDQVLDVMLLGISAVAISRTFVSFVQRSAKE